MVVAFFAARICDSCKYQIIKTFVLTIVAIRALQILSQVSAMTAMEYEFLFLFISLLCTLVPLWISCERNITQLIDSADKAHKVDFGKPLRPR